MPEFIHSGKKKKAYVQEMFNDISGRYDFLNHLLSFGMDYIWRKRVVMSLPVDLNGAVLDVATGTGDLGLAIKKKYPEIQLVGLDYAYKMVEIAKVKAKKTGLPGIMMIQGDGETLPFKNDQFAALTIAFGFRNIGHYDKALAEFFRVVEPGGSIYILEFSESNSQIFRSVYKFYFKNILPGIGAMFSRSDAYRYLPESVEHFPTREKLGEMITDAGFENVGFRNMNFGAVTLTTAQVPEG